MRDEDFHFTPEWLNQYLNAIIKYNIDVVGLIIPKELTALSRLYWGVFYIMSNLNAKGNFFQLTIPFIRTDVIALNSLIVNKKVV